MAKNKLPVAKASVEPVEVAMPTKAEDMKYKAKYALEDIERAEAHKQDRELMKHVKAAAKSKMKALGKIC